MKSSKHFVLHFFMFCLIIWQNVHSQLLYPDDKKGEYLPPYDPNVVIISPDVEKWMTEQLSKEGEKKAVEMKTDLLGRVKSSTDKTKPEVKFVENKQKRLVLVSDMHIPKIDIEPMSGSLEYNYETKEHDYYLNDKKVSVKEYENLIEKYHEKINSQKKGKRNIFVPGVVGSDERSWTAWMTAEEISKLASSYKELAIGDYLEEVSTASVSSTLSTLQLPSGNNGNGIGIGVVETGCRDTSIPIVYLSRYTNRCIGDVKTHHSRVVNVLQFSAPLAHIFGFSTATIRFPDPSLYTPNLHIVTRSYGNVLVTNRYLEQDMNLDNYIYDKRVINFVAAGNTGGLITSPSKALNAITVGAVCPAAPCEESNTIPNNYTRYSSWKNSEILNEKPEVAMYTDIDMGSYGFIDGTSAATPLAAGMAANLFSNFSNFFQQRPALTKAVFIAGEEIPIGNTNANVHDTDNVKIAKKVPTYSSVRGIWAAKWWRCANSLLNNDLIFTQNIPSTGRYRIVIAWEAFGSYILQNKKPPQDIDLYVSQGSTTLSSISSRNPFEVVEFNAASNAPLTIKIHRYSNSGSDEVHLGYAIRKIQ